MKKASKSDALSVRQGKVSKSHLRAGSAQRDSKSVCSWPTSNQLDFKLNCLTSNTDDARSDQLLDLALDRWVLHVLLKSRWVTLCLLQDGVHDWILHDRHNLFSS